MKSDASDSEGFRDSLADDVSDFDPRNGSSPRPSKRIKLGGVANEADNLKNLGGRPTAITRLKELDAALAGPQKRGRKVGSGANEQRKKDEDYSQNKNSKKDRMRRQKMNEARKEVHRGAGADRVAKSRALTKLKASQQYQAMTPEEQKIYEDITVAELFKDRNTTYSKEFVLAKLRAERDLLADELCMTQEFIAVHSELVKRDRDHDIFWEDVDSEDEDNNGAALPDMVDEVKDLPNDLADTVTTAILDGVANDTKPVEQYKGVRKLTDEGEAFKAAYKRQQAHPKLMTRSHQMWVLFRNGFLQHLARLDTKIKKLDALGDLRSYSYDIPKIVAAVKRGGIKLDFSNPVENYRQAEVYVVYRGVTPSWSRIIAAGKNCPKEIFSAVDRGMLRSLWGADEDEWIELPGPADCWPNDPAWYAANGFEVRVDQHENYRKALAALDSEAGLQDWEECLLHENTPYDLVWNKFFGLYGT